ncbi:ABC transporter permease [Oscillatoria sp. FACHB-1407]|uniref:ABC transporter permease n=1 Tax=Oscillatoria sp. FACHB-1407 TaxID=2692847 RepID=UPI001687A31E|nr:ABC transporter permease [Oscillatoria sp. FACHB-1407]MBD2462788.1 ABC transporter permease [Oscillatoria sp. FACHB-1407]
MQGIRRSGIFGDHRNFENYRDLLRVLVEKELKARYKNKALGYLWSVASPLTFAFVFYIAFGVIMRIDVPQYPLVLIAGLFPWQWLSNCINGSPRLFVGSAGLIKKVKFPRNIIPLTAIINHLIHYILSIPVILLFMLIYRVPLSLEWLYFPVLLVIQFAMAYGITLILSSLNLFLRDIERLVSVFMNLAFYFTPIIYTKEMIPTEYQVLLYGLNPFAALIVSWRDLFLMDASNKFVVDPNHVLIAAAYAVLFLVVGQYVYKKLEWKFAEVV